MLHVSFAITSEAYADGSKTETRRFWKDSHAKKFKPGVLFMGITKDFRCGGVRMHVSRVVSCRRQKLENMTYQSYLKEGGQRYWRYWPNRRAYVEMMGGKHRRPWVLVMEHGCGFTLRKSAECSGWMAQVCLGWPYCAARRCGSCWRWQPERIYRNRKTGRVGSMHVLRQNGMYKRDECNAVKPYKYTGFGFCVTCWTEGRENRFRKDHPCHIGLWETGP